MRDALTLGTMSALGGAATPRVRVARKLASTSSETPRFASWETNTGTSNGSDRGAGRVVVSCRT